MRRKLTIKKNCRNGPAHLRRKRSGFTLTEVIVAFSILVFAMVPILKGLTSAHCTSLIIEHNTKSICLAQGKLGDIKARSIYSYSSNFTESDTPLDGSYLCNVTDDQDASLRTITVSVGYDGNADAALSGSEVSITLKTYIAKRW